MTNKAQSQPDSEYDTQDARPDSRIEPVSHSSAKSAPLDKIVPDGSQTRKEFPDEEIQALAENIKLNGLITPILVAALPEENEKYKIIDGERRYRAYQKLNEDKKSGDRFQNIPVTIIENDNALVGILANMARKVYNPMESAEALNEIKAETKYTDEQIARLVEKSRSSVTEYLGLLGLPEEIRKRAKADSCVPFRALKRLASMEGTDEEKIEAYNKLENKYKPKEQPKKKREGSGAAWTADRRAEKLGAKVANFMDYMEKVKVADIKDDARKEAMRKELDILLEKVTKIRRELGQ